jgi:hypothetical protein
MVRQAAASRGQGLGRERCRVACKPERERAPNTRLQLTGALALPRQGGCRE